MDYKKKYIKYKSKYLNAKLHQIGGSLTIAVEKDMIDGCVTGKITIDGKNVINFKSYKKEKSEKDIKEKITVYEATYTGRVLTEDELNELYNDDDVKLLDENILNKIKSIMISS